MNRALKIVFAVIVGASLVSGSFAAGVAVDRLIQAGDVPGITEETSLSQLVDEVARKIRLYALEPSSDESMTAGAIRGLLESLDDPYAAYFDEDHYRYVEEMNDGEFFGIGVTVTEREGKAIIVGPIEGTPAFEAGLVAEDEIVSVDGYTPETWTLDDVVARVRGEEGTEVVLEIRREGEEDLITVAIVRARIDIPNTMSEMLEDGIGYVRLLSFNVKSAEELRDILEGLEAEGARAFILDLRDNPGGLLSSSVDVASLFVEDGVIVRVEEREGPVEVYRARGHVATEVPMVVLINEYSASASEIVAGALQDHGRATLVGQATFGKGSVQTIEALSDGSAIKFTTAHYVTPEGRSIHKKGLAPDIEVEMDPQDQVDRETDIQLLEAVEFLRSRND